MNRSLKEMKEHCDQVVENIVQECPEEVDKMQWFIDKVINIASIIIFGPLFFLFILIVTILYIASIIIAVIGSIPLTIMSRFID